MHPSKLLVMAAVSLSSLKVIVARFNTDNLMLAKLPSFGALPSGDLREQCRARSSAVVITDSSAALSSDLV